PTLRRHQQTVFLPVDPDDLADLGPHQRVTLAGQYDHLRAGGVPVRFFVGAGLDRHNVPDHGIARQMNTEAAESHAALGIFGQLNGVDVGYEVYRFVYEVARAQLRAEITPSGRQTGLGTEMNSRR